MTLENALRWHPAVRDWLHRLYSLRYAHGSQLVQDLGTARGSVPGLFDNCWAADQILETLIEHRWVVRQERPSPSRAQIHFGVGGFGPGRRRKAETSHPQEFGYTPSPNLLSLLKEHRL